MDFWNEGTVPYGFYLEITMIMNHGYNLPDKLICDVLALTHLTFERNTRMTLTIDVLTSVPVN